MIGGRLSLPSLLLGIALVAAPWWPSPDGRPEAAMAWADDDDDNDDGGDDDDGNDDRDDDDRNDRGGGDDDDDLDDRAAGPSGAASGTGRDSAFEAAPSTIQRSRSDRFVADEVLVADAAPGFADAARDLGFTVLDQRPLGTLGVSVARLRLPPGVAMADARDLLHRSFPDLLFDVNSLYRAQQSFSLPPAGYAREQIRWQVGSTTCGTDIVIGMIDTAVDLDHPAFAGRNVLQRSFGKGGVPAQHGTAVASILVGAGGASGPLGLLPDSRLRVAAAFAAGDEGGLDATAFDIAAALDWLIGSGATVVNLSLAGGPNRLLDLVLDRVEAQGVVAVAAVGNGGPRALAAYPAAHPAVLAATAVDHRNEVWAGANRGDYVDFAAPGVQIAAAAGEFNAFFTGTSFAAPFVTAAAALRQAALMRNGAVGDVDAVRRDLAGSAIDLGRRGRDGTYGYGLIQGSMLCG